MLVLFVRSSEAQGGYFKACSRRYAELTGKDEEEATALFASYFASVYLFFEIAFKFVAAWSKSTGDSGTGIMYATFVGIGVLSSIGMTMIGEAPEPAGTESQSEAERLGIVKTTPTATLALLVGDKRMMLMVPTQMSFGFMVAFLNSYLNSEIVTKGPSNPLIVCINRR
jgi:hypothetical protein